MSIIIPPISLVELEKRRDVMLHTFNTRFDEEYRGSLDNLTPLGQKVKTLMSIDFVVANFEFLILEYGGLFNYLDMGYFAELVVGESGSVYGTIEPLDKTYPYVTELLEDNNAVKSFFKKRFGPIQFLED